LRWCVIARVCLLTVSTELIFFCLSYCASFAVHCSQTILPRTNTHLSNVCAESGGAEPVGLSRPGGLRDNVCGARLPAAGQAEHGPQPVRAFFFVVVVRSVQCCVVLCAVLCVQLSGHRAGAVRGTSAAMLRVARCWWRPPSVPVCVSCARVFALSSVMKLSTLRCRK
jgi:hypothetical protein